MLLTVVCTVLIHRGRARAHRHRALRQAERSGADRARVRLEGPCLVAARDQAGFAIAVLSSTDAGHDHRPSRAIFLFDEPRRDAAADVIGKIHKRFKAPYITDDRDRRWCRGWAGFSDRDGSELTSMGTLLALRHGCRSGVGLENAFNPKATSLRSRHRGCRVRRFSAR